MRNDADSFAFQNYLGKARSQPRKGEKMDTRLSKDFVAEEKQISKRIEKENLNYGCGYFRAIYDEQEGMRLSMTGTYNSMIEALGVFIVEVAKTYNVNLLLAQNQIMASVADEYLSQLEEVVANGENKSSQRQLS